LSDSGYSFFSAVAHPAGLRAFAAVAASFPDHRGHQAAAAHAYAQCAVDKDLALYPAVAERFYILRRRFPRHHNAGKAEVFKQFNRAGRVLLHLGARVQHNVRKRLL